MFRNGCPVRAELVHLVDHELVLLGRPRGEGIGWGQIIEPPVAALARCVARKELRNLVPVRARASRDELGEHAVLFGREDATAARCDLREIVETHVDDVVSDLDAPFRWPVLSHDVCSEVRADGDIERACVAEDVRDFLGIGSVRKDEIGSVLVAVFVVGGSEGKDSRCVFGMGIVNAQADIITVPFIFDSYEIEKYKQRLFTLRVLSTWEIFDCISILVLGTCV